MPEQKTRPVPCRIVTYVQLVEGQPGDAELADEIATHVKSRLAAYEAPRVVRFIAQMPMTTTGKIIRAELRKLAEAEAAADDQ